MTPRPLARTRTPRAVALAASAMALMTLAGCDPRSLIYFLQPFSPTIEPPCTTLTKGGKAKRVVVVTNAAPGASSDPATVTIDRDLNREVIALLKEKVKKIDVVDPSMVETWVQNNPSWTESADLAKAFEADVVIFLELRHFEIQNPNSPGLFEGRSNVHIRVTEWDHPKDDRGRPMKDKPRESKMVYEGDRDTAFPVTGHIPVSAEVTRSGFKTKFLKLVATEVSWHFIEHAPGDNIQNSRFGEE